MTVFFFCAKCGVELTPDLVELPAVPEVSGRDRDRDKETRLAPSTVPRGHYAIDPEPWGAPFAPPTGKPRPHHPRRLLMPPELADWTPTGPRNTVVVHPDDVPDLRLLDRGGPHRGCCGPLGTGGRNIACGCGVLVATLAADCMGPHELHLDPVRVYAFDTKGAER
ncbi:hypothetical protein OHA79_28905 [Streptomyces sp. NBC_00841]|uniref:hypothetical protein n=1 Tax=unclassified Streptomyces TaxID=2593676 RepID=UPI0022527FB9|nr:MULTISPECIES: hypothetical protein [unclassified Streptomyces]MCX4533046.1 hypothetical protein [Streptomyces sp. NBC_01669]WSA01505.1 hypothetical protein OHA79_28905 [Streptomyces sp. NBC_00841]